MAQPACNPVQRAVRSAQVVLSCDPLQPTLEFFTTRLGFRVDAIFPADAPSTAVLSGHGLTVRLHPGDLADTGVLRLLCDDIVVGGVSL